MKRRLLELVLVVAVVAVLAWWMGPTQAPMRVVQGEHSWVVEPGVEIELAREPFTFESAKIRNEVWFRSRFALSQLVDGGPSRPGHVDVGGVPPISGT